MTIEEFIEILKTFPKYYTVHFRCDNYEDGTKENEEIYELTKYDITKFVNNPGIVLGLDTINTHIKESVEAVELITNDRYELKIKELQKEFKKQINESKAYLDSIQQCVMNIKHLFSMQHKLLFEVKYDRRK